MYRPLGMPKIQSKMVVDAWAHLLKRLYKIRSKANLAHCIWLFGWRVGRLKGCIKHRVMAP